MLSKQANTHSLLLLTSSGRLRSDDGLAEYCAGVKGLNVALNVHLYSCERDNTPAEHFTVVKATKIC